MHDTLLELPIEDLARGAHERCHACHMDFPIVDGRLRRVRGPDAKYYCTQYCVSNSGR